MHSISLSEVHVDRPDPIEKTKKPYLNQQAKTGISILQIVFFTKVAQILGNIPNPKIDQQIFGFKTALTFIRI